MQIDVHYYGVAFLARAAGFCLEDSEVIAYASQYVDDSTEGDNVHVGEYTFDPVRTAHYSLKFLSWSIQSKIFMPFHFLPSGNSNSDLTTKVYSQSALAKELFQQACAESSERVLRLVRIGVALHTIADTYSHQGFSGRDGKENDLDLFIINNIDSQQEGSFWITMKSLPVKVWKKIKRQVAPALPNVGHIQALHNPDKAFLDWDFVYADNNEKVHRNNPQVFMEACQQIYELLCHARQILAEAGECMDSETLLPLKSWEAISPSVEKCLKESLCFKSRDNCVSVEDDLEHRCKNWQIEFCACFCNGERMREYNKYEWRIDALKPEDESFVEWDRRSKGYISEHHYPDNPEFFSSKWVKFHKAAMTQRYLFLYSMKEKY